MIQNKNYNIYIDTSMVELNAFFENNINAFSKIFILVDENTHQACIPSLLSKVPYLQESEIIEIEPGEASKEMETASSLWYALMESGADRQSLLINLGGGVITDLGGFVAATYKRGIPFINIPTTLLGQIDAAVGSKTAIDLGNSKNQVGVFAHPRAVFINTEFIDTLPTEEINSALGEFIKYALVFDLDLWEYVKSSEYNKSDFNYMVSKCLEIKNRIISEDLYENNIRKTLNFGHTIGHAFESFSLSKNKELRHGEAVAMGIIVESYLSYKVLGFSSSVQKEISKYILSNFDYLPIETDDIDKLIDFMRNDKKNDNGKISFVLLKEIGKAEYDQFITEDVIKDALKHYYKLA
ncbi:MAG: 3-dehydroquinate synthase [Bacteroidales bacterium]|nr:3-dehydroquinate synthase [Bacteroidales bacterium]